MDVIPYQDLAKATRELYRAYRWEGFTEAQAMELVKSQYAFCMINHTVKAEKRKHNDLRRRFNNIEVDDVSKLFGPPRKTSTP